MSREDAIAEFVTYSKAVHAWVVGQVGRDRVDDVIQETFLQALLVLDRQAVIFPRGLFSHILRIQIAGVIKANYRVAGNISVDVVLPYLASTDPSPEQQAVHWSLVSTARRTIQGQDREILDRAFVAGESAAETMAAMRLTGTQYRNLKSRAKEKVITRLRKAGTYRRLVNDLEKVHKAA